ncbi:hypothetical protein GCM10009092_43960 [Bowmanella denitrificans]|uniref:VWFA domain-containing protein n=2 Tax=Bowmanella denitrificans TaxID=366582 RepID=A0ABN0XWV9_9ALTE
MTGGLLYLDSGAKAIELPRHLIAIFDCNTTSLLTVENELKKFSNISSISLVTFTSDNNKQCSAFSEAQHPFSSIDYRSDVNTVWPDRVGIATSEDCEDSASNLVNNIICGIDFARENKRFKHWATVSVAILILENQSQLTQNISDIATNENSEAISKSLDLMLVKKLLSLHVPLHILNRSIKNDYVTTSELKWVNDVSGSLLFNKQTLHLQLSNIELSRTENISQPKVTTTFRELVGPGCNEISESKEHVFYNESFPFLSWEGSNNSVIYSASPSYLTNIGVWRLACNGWIQLESKASITKDRQIDFPSASVYLEQKSTKPVIFLIGENEGRLSRETWWKGLTTPSPSINLIQEINRDSFLGKYDLYAIFLRNLANQLEEKKCIYTISTLRSGSETLDRRCLSEADSVVIIEPSTEDLVWIDQKQKFESYLINNGKVIAIIGPPVASDILPTWVNGSKPAPGKSFALTTHQEMKIQVIFDRSILAQAYPNGISQQREIIYSLLKDNEKYLKCEYPGSSDTDRGTIVGGDDLEFLVPRATFSYAYDDTSPVLARVDISGPQKSDLYNKTSTGGDFNQFKLDPYLDSIALLQLTRFVNVRGGKDAWSKTKRPNTIVVLFAADVYQPELSTVDKEALKAFFESGARVIVVPLPENEEYVSKEQVKLFMKQHYPRGAEGPFQALQAIGGDSVIKANFNAGDIQSRLTYKASDMQRAGFGRSFDSEADCVRDNNGNYCGVIRKGGKRSGPERFTPLLPTDVFLDSALTTVVSNGDTDVIYTEHEFGKSRIHTYGYSPFARDFIERDAHIGLTPPEPTSSNSKPWMSDSCFLPGESIQVDNEELYRYSTHTDGWGLQSLLDIMRISAADISNTSAGHISAIESKDHNSLDIMVSADEAKAWEEPKISRGHIAAPVGYDPINQFVTYRVRRTESVPGYSPSPIVITSQGLSTPIAAVLQPPAAGDSVYGLLRKVSEMSGGTSQLYYGVIPFTANKSGTATISVIVLTGVLFLMSGFVRPWKGAKLSIMAFLRRHNTTILRDVSAVGFSVQAVLTEWGANVGRPGTGRHAGVPLGVRNLISGDSLASVFWVDLIGIVSPERFPMKKPRVKLRSLNQSKESLIVLDSTGALNFPAINEKITKSEFACRLASALALAMRASGSVKLATTSARPISLDVEPDTDPNHLESELYRQVAESREAFQLDHKEITDDEENRYIIVIIDPLSASTSQIEKLSERVMANGASFSLLLVVSEEELNANMLLRDIQSGTLVDRSEWTQAETRLIRDKRLGQIRASVEGHGGKVAIFDTKMVDSEVLSEIRESGVAD